MSSKRIRKKRGAEKARNKKEKRGSINRISSQFNVHVRQKSEILKLNEGFRR